ncbi:hypothetical protein ME1_00943 [Bartonella vinsonii subsp. arupensis OK-94-513]|uniref:Uncharacterized protein n=2 Tax=Bartonella vinsonii subsp. arupensis TaxID=110578 RepID=J0QXT9_BARVI|nr:hypothetical protein ME1_00943 [Bartonella vinsonii subsp. arupensis OK-94-513]EJF96797.1 hypothetical protein MEI_01409 [Bartonella vinsonii subsp. arupensis Pm136co]
MALTLALFPSEVILNLYTIGLAYLIGYISKNINLLLLIVLFCYGTNMLMDLTVRTEHEISLNHLSFSSSGLFLGIKYYFNACTMHEEINQLLTFFRTSVVLPRNLIT